VLAERPGSRGAYECFALDQPQNNARLRCVEYSDIKKPDDPAVWHRQHFFTTGRTCSPDECAGYLAEHRRQAAASQAAQAAAAAERARVQEIGRQVWAEVWPAGCHWAIMAERIHDDSDIQTDYFGEHTEETVILAPSRKQREDFAEMRKAALLLPEIRHLGPGCDCWRVMVKAAPDDESNRTWRGRLNEYEHGRGYYATAAEAQAALDAALAADAADNARVPFEPFSPRLPWGGELARESIEYREKYTGGKGYYLQANWANPWRVSKARVTVYRDGAETDEPNPETLYCLGKRHEHLLK
jgi:hypothetical protein